MWINKYCQRIGGYNLCQIKLSGKYIYELWFDKEVIKRGSFEQCNDYFKEHQNENKQEYSISEFVRFQPFVNDSNSGGA